MSKCLHLINATNLNRGGAQKALSHIRQARGSLDPVFCLYDKGREDAYVGGGLWWIKLVILLIKLRPKVVVAHSRIFLPFIWAVEKFSRIKTVFICHSRFPNKLWLFKLFPVGNIVGVSQTVSSALNDVLGRNCVKTIFNGVEEKTIQDEGNRRKGVFGFVGRLDSNKGVSVGIEALSIVAERMKKDLILHIVGDGPERAKLEGLDRSSRLAIVFHGYVSKPFSVLSEVDAVLVPSFFEGFCLVLPEAMIHCKRVFASDLPVLREVSAQASTVDFFPVGCSESLSRAIERYLDQDEESVGLRREAAVLALDLYGVENMKARYRELLNDLANQIV